MTGLPDLASALRAGLDTMATCLEEARSRQQQLVNPAVPPAAAPSNGIPWIKDRDLQGRLTVLQEAGAALSTATTRLTLVVSKDPSESAVASIVAEMVGLVEGFVGRYLEVIACRLGDPLHQTVTFTVRSELRQLMDLVTLLSDDTPGNARNSRTGMVWKASDALKTLPLSNKAAYRRFVMERMVAVKDTVSEFDGYLAVVKEDLARPMHALALDADAEEDEDEDEEEELDDGAEYTDADVPLLEESVAALSLSLDMLKAGLAVMTSVGDAYARTAEEEAAPPLPPPPPPSTAAGTSSQAGTATSAEEAPPSGFHVDAWVAAVAAQSGTLEAAVTDFGAALYPPLDDDARALVGRQADAWREASEAYLRLLQQPPALPHGVPWEAEARAVADVRAALADTVRRSPCLFGGDDRAPHIPPTG